MDTIAVWFHDVSIQWGDWCLASLVSSSVVLLIVGTLWLVALRGRSPQLVCMLFLLVLVKPFFPIDIEIPQRIADNLPITPIVSSPDRSVALPPVELDLAEIDTHELGVSSTDGLTTSAVDESLPSMSALDSRPTQMAPHSAGVAAAVVKPTMTTRSTPWISSVWTIPFLLYAVSLAYLLARFFASQWRFHRQVVALPEISPDQFPIDMKTVCRRAGLKRIPRLVEMNTDSPAVWGLLSPTIILPKNLAKDLSDPSLRWAILHELAHIKRHDLLFHALQRLLTIVQFFNPMAWIASAMISRFREQACDDMALVWSDRESIAASEAFMHIVRRSSESPSRGPQFSTSLGVFSSGSKQAIAHRMRRLLDTDRPLRERMGLIAGGVLLLSALALLPKLRAVAETPQPTPEPAPVAAPQANDAFVPAIESGEFELNVVGPDQTPVKNASVEIRPRIQSEWEVLVGSFDRKASYGVFYKTDDKGRLRIKLPDEKLSQLNFSIKAEGYGLFWAQWRMGDESEVLPAKYVAELDAGQTIGGVLVDEDGKPIEGAKVHPSIEYKKRKSDESQLSTGWRATTDEKGRWTCPYVPATFDSLAVEITHDAFAVTRKSLAAADYRVESDQQPTEKIVVSRGVTLRGRITDRAGNPIKDAKIRSVFINETKVASTNDNGEYAMPGCKLGDHQVTVTAPKYAPDQQLVTFESGLEDVNFQLAPGNTVRVKVVDKDGNPQEKTRIFFRRWRQDEYGKGLGMVHAYTDADGIWEWNEAPEDAFIVDVCPRDCVQLDSQTLQAKEPEFVYTFTAVPALEIIGKVVDSESGEPLDDFRVVPGMVWANAVANAPFWMRRESFDGKNGTFALRRNRSDGLHAVRVEAENYVSATSRAIKFDEGKVTIELKLKPAVPITMSVTTPDGSPAIQAEALLGVPGTQIQIEDGSFGSGTYGKRVKTDSNGVLTIPQDDANMRLVVLHETGYADLYLKAGEGLKSIELIEWATVRGTLLHSGKPAQGIQLGVIPNNVQPAPEVPHISWQSRTVTNASGEFVFTKIRPGEVTIYKMVTTHDTGRGLRQSYTHRVPIELQPGEERRIEVGASTVHVTGKVVAEIGQGVHVDWEFSSLELKHVIGEDPEVPYPVGLSEEQRNDWRKNWIETTEEGKQYVVDARERFQKKIQRFVGKVQDDGAFEIFGVPPGIYRLTVQLDARPADGRFDYKKIGEAGIELDLTDAANQTRDVGEIVVK